MDSAIFPDIFHCNSSNFFFVNQGQSPSYLVQVFNSIAYLVIVNNTAPRLAEPYYPIYRINQTLNSYLITPLFFNSPLVANSKAKRTTAGLLNWLGGL